MMDSYENNLALRVSGLNKKNKLGAQLLGNMYVYAGSEHKHEAQKPETLTF